MSDLETRFAHWVIETRWWILITTLAVVGACSLGLSNLYFTTDYRVFFSPENPQRLAFEALEHTYAKNDNVLFILVPEDGNVFSRKTLSVVEALTEKAWQTPYSSRVNSLSNFQHTSADHDDLLVRDLVSQAHALDDEALEVIRSIALAEPLLVGRLVSSEGHVTAVNITVQLPGVSSTAETPEVVSFVRSLADEVRSEHPEIQIRLAGMVMMNNAFTEASKLDVSTLIPLSFGLMLLTLAALLRNLSATLTTLLVIAFSIVTALGVGGFIGFPISPPSAAAPTIILTVSMASAVHVLVTLLRGLRQGRDRNEAIIESLRVNLQPVFLAALTTAIGFLTMNFSEVPPFQHLGNMVAVGVVASFAYSVTFLPAAMSLLPMRVSVRRRESSVDWSRFANLVIRRRRVLLWGGGGVIVLLVSFVPKNELNDVFVHYFDESVVFRQDTDFLSDNLTGPMLIEYSLSAKESGGISEPGFLREVASLVGWLRRQPETMHIHALTDTMKQLNRNMHGDDEAFHRLPETRELAAQYLLLYEMSLPYGLDLNNQINLDKSALRITVSNRIMSTNEVLAFDQRVFDWLSEHAPHVVPARGTGGPIMFAHIGKRNIVAMLRTTVALVLISLLLVVALRSVRVGLASMAPNLVPAAMGFGLWGIFDGQIGLALSVVTTMTLGIVVDDTVHFLSKYLRGRREMGLDAPDAVRYWVALC